jgi:hypothetical protein
MDTEKDFASWEATLRSCFPPSENRPIIITPRNEPFKCIWRNCFLVGFDIAKKKKWKSGCNSRTYSLLGEIDTSNVFLTFSSFSVPYFSFLCHHIRINWSSFAAGKRIEVWNYLATCTHRKTTIFSSIVYGLPQPIVLLMKWGIHLIHVYRRT